MQIRETIEMDVTVGERVFWVRFEVETVGGYENHLRDWCQRTDVVSDFHVREYLDDRMGSVEPFGDLPSDVKQAIERDAIHACEEHQPEDDEREPDYDSYDREEAYDW